MADSELSLVKMVRGSKTPFLFSKKTNSLVLLLSLDVTALCMLGNTKWPSSRGAYKGGM